MRSLLPLAAALAICRPAVGEAAAPAMNMTCAERNVTTQRAQVSEWKTYGWPEVWASGSQPVTVKVTDSCGLIIENPFVVGTSSVVFNATTTEPGYLLRVDVDSLQGENGKQVGIIMWQVAQTVTDPWDKASFVYQLGQGYSVYGVSSPPGMPKGMFISPTDFCTGGLDSRPKTMMARVANNSIFTVTVVMRSGQEVSKTYDLSALTRGRPPSHLGIENNGLSLVNFSLVEAVAWQPVTVPDTRAMLCQKDLMAEVKLYFIALGVGLAIITVHIAMAYRLVKGNFMADNTPHFFSMMSTVVAGLDFCGEIGQVVYLHVLYRNAKQVASRDAGTLEAYYRVSLVVVVLSLAYSFIVVAYVIVRSGRFMNTPLLLKNKAFFCIQAVVSVTNLELLALFPWDYRAFGSADMADEIRDLEGFPSTLFMRLAAVPIITVDIPMAIIQILTQNVQSLNFTQSVLIVIQVVSGLDLMCRFISRVFITSAEVESKRKRAKSSASCALSDVPSSETALSSLAAAATGDSPSDRTASASSPFSLEEAGLPSTWPPSQQQQQQQPWSGAVVRRIGVRSDVTSTESLPAYFIGQAPPTLPPQVGEHSGGQGVAGAVQAREDRRAFSEAMRRNPSCPL